MYRTKIKICGLTRKKDIINISSLGIDAIGFVFYPLSPRYIKNNNISNLINCIPPFITKVGLFVEQSLENIKYVLKYNKLSILQFHGNESPEQCSNIAYITKLPFLKTKRISKNTTSLDILEYEKKYKNCSNLYNGLILDTKTNNYGGSGKTFNWKIIPNKIKSKIILSGGININNISQAISEIKPYAIDISSGVEKKYGIKDKNKVKKIVNKINKINFKTKK